MKRLLAATVMAIAGISSAHAVGVMATMNNDAGGRIELYDRMLTPSDAASLTNDQCKAGDSIAKTWSTSDKDHYGCWEFNDDGDTITVYWMTARRYQTYRISDFQITAYGQKTYGNVKGADILWK